MLFITRAGPAAPSRLSSWVFLVGSAGAMAEIYVQQPRSPQAPPAPAGVSPELRAFTAHCGGVDSRDRPAAAAGGDDGGGGRRKQGSVGFESLNVAIGLGWEEGGEVPPLSI